MAKKLAHSFTSTELFECPRRYNEIKLLNTFSDGDSFASSRGSRLHKEWEHALLHGNGVGDEYDWVLQYVREKFTGLKFAEKKLAIDYNFKPCDWRSSNTFYRAIIDVGVINCQHLDTIDYKTGKFRPKPRQGLEQMLLAMIHFPQIKTGSARFLWTDADAAPTVTHYDKEKQADEMLDQLLEIPREIEKAREKDDWPEKPDTHCNWCPVVSCTHNKHKDPEFD